MHRKITWPMYMAELAAINGVIAFICASFMDISISQIKVISAIWITFIFTSLMYGIQSIISKDKRTTLPGSECMMVFLLSVTFMSTFGCYLFYRLKNYSMCAVILVVMAYCIWVVIYKEFIEPRRKEHVLIVSNENYKRAYDTFSCDLSMAFVSINYAERAYKDCLATIELLSGIEGCEADADEFRKKLDITGRNYSYDQAYLALQKMKSLIPIAQKVFNKPLASNEVKYGILELARIFCNEYRDDAENAASLIRGIQLDAYRLVTNIKRDESGEIRNTGNI